MQNTLPYFAEQIALLAFATFKGKSMSTTLKPVLTQSLLPLKTFPLIFPITRIIFHPCSIRSLEKPSRKSFWKKEWTEPLSCLEAQLYPLKKYLPCLDTPIPAIFIRLSALTTEKRQENILDNSSCNELKLKKADR